jgi:hypothetical protein
VDIGALADIRTSLNIMKNSIHETIIEELHRLIYLKTPFTQVAMQMFPATALRSSIKYGTVMAGAGERTHSHSRQNSSAASGRSLGVGANSSANNNSNNNNRVSRQSTETLTGKQQQPSGGGGAGGVGAMGSNSSRPRANSDINSQFQMGEVVEDLLVDPQLNPLRFIEVMLTALDELGRLQDAAQVIKQRIPLELFKITETIIRETELNWAIALFSDTTTGTGGLAGTPSAAAYSRGDGDMHVASKLSKLKNSLGTRFLEDLLRRLYEKLFSVLQMHNFAIHAFLRINLVCTA